MRSKKCLNGLRGAFHAALLVLILSTTVLSCSQAAKTLARVREAVPFGHATYRSDFYAAVNREWLAQYPEPPVGNNSWTSFIEISENNDQKTITLLDSLAAGTFPKGSKEQKLADYYRSSGDLGQRDAAGAAPLKPYLDGYANAKSLTELMDADLTTLRGIGISTLLNFDVGSNQSGTPVLVHSGPTPCPADVFKSAGGKKIYIRYLTDLFALAGNSPKDAAAKAQKVYAYEKSLSGYTLSPAERINPANTIPYPMYLFRTLYSTFDFPAYFAKLGFKTPEAIIVTDQRLMEKAAASFTENNREVLALYAQARLLDAFSLNLSTGFLRAKDRFSVSLFHYSSKMNWADWPKRLAVLNTQDVLSEYLGESFSKAYFSPRAKKDVEEMIGRIKAVYKKQIGQTDWMEPYTKERALKKLDGMAVKVGYPEVWPDSFKTVDIRGKADGGTYFGNLTALLLARNANAAARLGVPAQRAEWRIPVYMVNAMDNFDFNEIVIPAGILQEPFYNVDWPTARNLGGIGTVIAHEISHAFDNNGAQYDESGSFRKWWTKDDYARFNAKCETFARFYDKLPIAPGIRNDGKLTVSENVSDVLGMQCALQVLAETDKPDYPLFFNSYATIWRISSSWPTEKYLSRHDVHSNNKIRVNRTVSNFQEFQDAFGVVPGDAMYVKPEDRVGIW